MQCISKVTKPISNNSKTRRWQNVRAALMTVWKADKLEAISKQLDLYRSELILRILVILEARNASQAAHLDNRLDRIERSNQQVIEVIAINQTKTEAAHEIKATEIVNTQHHALDAQQRQAKTIAAILTFKDGTTKVLSTNALEEDRLLYKSNFQTALTLRREVKGGPYNDSIDTAETANLVTFAGGQRILNMLFFRHMDHRHEEVAAAYQKTFDWIFDDETSDVPWDNFVDWLKSGYGCYWIDGKAGSGKSTLMKYIFGHEKTRTMLQNWAGRRELALSSFYFWNIGSPLQKSQLGLLRALLFSLLESRPRLIPLAFPGLCRAALNEKADLSDPTLVELKQAVSLLVQQTKNTMRLCFVIDGIDEYDGDHAEISLFLKSLAACDNVKMIVSSRPIPACVEVFSPLPHLRLQDLTYDDIQVYVRNTLRGHPNMKKLESRNRAQVEALVAEITRKASGVFLWVILVVKSLLEGLRNHDRIEDLETRLQELPADLESLYQHMLDNMRPSYRKQAEHMLQIVLRSLDIQRETHLLTALQFSFAEDYDYEDVISAPIVPISEMERRDRQEEIEGRIRSRCCGLLELHGRPHRKLAITATVEPTVGFLHKTVVEFLRQPHFHVRYDEQLVQGRIDISLSCSCLMMVKTIEMGTSTLSKSHSIMQYAEYCLSYLSSLPEAQTITAMALFWALDAAMTAHLNTVESGPTVPSRQIVQTPEHWSSQMVRFLSQPLASDYASGGQERKTATVMLTAIYGRPDLARRIFQSTQFTQDDLALLLGQLMLSLFEGRLHTSFSPDVVHEASGRRRQYIAEIIKMTLEQGANPNAKCAFEGDRTHWHGAKDFDLDGVAYEKQKALFEKTTQLCSAWELLLTFLACLRPNFLNKSCFWPCTICTGDKLLVLELVESLLNSGTDKDVTVVMGQYLSRVDVGEEDKADEANTVDEIDQGILGDNTNDCRQEDETDETSDEEEAEYFSYGNAGVAAEGKTAGQTEQTDKSSKVKEVILHRMSALGVLKRAMNHFLHPPLGRNRSVRDNLNMRGQRILAQMMEQGALDKAWHNNVSVERLDQLLRETARPPTPDTSTLSTRSTKKTLNPFVMLANWWSTLTG